jgi:hypothetical protein
MNKGKTTRYNTYLIYFRIYFTSFHAVNYKYDTMQYQEPKEDAKDGLDKSENVIKLTIQTYV